MPRCKRQHSPDGDSGLSVDGAPVRVTPSGSKVRRQLDWYLEWPINGVSDKITVFDAKHSTGIKDELHRTFRKGIVSTGSYSGFNSTGTACCCCIDAIMGEDFNIAESFVLYASCENHGTPQKALMHMKTLAKHLHLFGDILLRLPSDTREFLTNKVEQAIQRFQAYRYTMLACHLGERKDVLISIAEQKRIAG